MQSYRLRFSKSILFNLHLFSVEVKEDNIAIFNKLTKRIEHVTGLKANTSQFEAEHMLVSYDKCYCHNGIQRKFLSNQKLSQTL